MEKKRRSRAPEPERRSVSLKKWIDIDGVQLHGGVRRANLRERRLVPLAAHQPEVQRTEVGQRDAARRWREAGRADGRQRRGAAADDVLEQVLLREDRGAAARRVVGLRER